MSQTEIAADGKRSERYTQGASIALEEGMRFAGETGGHRLKLDVPAEYGGGEAPQPMQLLLLSLAGCTGMDVLSILRKKRQRVTGLEVEARGRRAKEHLRVFDRVEVFYRIRGEGVNETAIERAIDLSRDRYCPVIATVRSTAEVLTSYEVEHDLERDAAAGTGIWEDRG